MPRPRDGGRGVRRGRPPVRRAKGELVCTAPFPSMPLGFWNDPDGAKYRAAYFERFPGVWCHGDWAERTAHDGMIIYGRSRRHAQSRRRAHRHGGDLSPGRADPRSGWKRSAIGQDWDGDVRIVLFVRLRDGLELDDALRDKIRETIRRTLTPRHVPAKMIQVADIPRTERQDHRTRRAQPDPRHRGHEPRGGRQPRRAGFLRRHPGAEETAAQAHHRSCAPSAPPRLSEGAPQSSLIQRLLRPQAS